jgi:hypothetical protein
MQKTARLDSQVYCAKTKRTTLYVELHDGKSAKHEIMALTPVELYRSEGIMDLLAADARMHIAFLAGMQETIEHAEKIKNLKKQNTSRRNKGRAA